MARRLVTMLGTGAYEPVCWARDGDPECRHTSRYAPVATAALCGPFEDVVLLLTVEAREAHGAACRGELEALGVRVREEMIPLGLSDEDLWQVFSTVCAVVDAGTEVVLDVTHALRHLPMVLFAAAAYLTTLRDVSIAGVYYGGYAARAGQEAPLVDLGALLTLASWSHGVRAFRESGSPAWLARLVRTETARIARAGPPPRLGALASGLERLACTLPAGLPVAAGVAARGLANSVEAAEGDPTSSPLLRSVYRALQEMLAPIACAPGAIEKSGRLRLDRHELARQLRVARAYWGWGQPDRTLLLLREWLVSGCLLAERSAGGSAVEAPDGWIRRRRRQSIEDRLHGLEKRAETGTSTLTEPQRRLVSLWGRVTRHRNTLAHAGFSEPGPKPGSHAPEVAEILRDCELLLSDETAWSTERPGAGGQLLVTALGAAPGVLYTALQRLRPDAALVVTSTEGAVGLGAACARAGWLPESVLRYEVADAFACFREADKVRDWARTHLLAAGTLLVNHTGGTTGMQYLVERVADEATRLGVPVRRYALIDRRDSAAQRLDPFVEGEVVTLETDRGARHDS